MDLYVNIIYLIGRYVEHCLTIRSAQLTLFKILTSLTRGESKNHERLTNDPPIFHAVCEKTRALSPVTASRASEQYSEAPGLPKPKLITQHTLRSNTFSNQCITEPDQQLIIHDCRVVVTPKIIATSEPDPQGFTLQNHAQHTSKARIIYLIFLSLLPHLKSNILLIRTSPHGHAHLVTAAENMIQDRLSYPLPIPLRSHFPKTHFESLRGSKFARLLRSHPGSKVFQD